MSFVTPISRRRFCGWASLLPGLPVACALPVLSASGLLTGCTTGATEGDLDSADVAPVDDGGPALVFLPDLSAAPELVLEARLRVRFLPKATESGAPATPPALRAMIMTSPKSVNAGFAVMGFTAWTIVWTADGIHEKRHPKLNKEVLADRMLRDLTLIHWPVAALQAALPAGVCLKEDASGRSVLRHGVTILRVSRQTIGQVCRTTLTNPIEGYVLTIEEAHAR